MSTIEDLIQDLRNIANKNNPSIPFNLHQGLRLLIATFGNASDAMDWFEQYRRTRHDNK